MMRSQQIEMRGKVVHITPSGGATANMRIQPESAGDDPYPMFYTAEFGRPLQVGDKLRVTTLVNYEVEE
jgi:hypothetical protein